MLTALDQTVNAVFGPLLNLLLSEGGAPFGAADETLSSVMGKNVERGTCRVCTWVCRVLHAIDSDHCRDSIERDEGPKNTR